MPKEPEELVFSVWFKGKELEGTRAELRQLVNDVEESLSKATELCVKPPKVDRGNLSYDSMKDFFSQAYPEKNLLGSHATQLFKQLLSGAKSGSGLAVYCGVCKKRPNVTHCNDKKPHNSHPERFLIQVASLKEVTEPVIERNKHFRNIGPKLREDLRVLVEKL